jgi:hypothetical protein
MAVSGERGSIRWGYRSVAAVSAWTLTKAGGVTSVTGSVSDVDSYGISQRPLLFIVTRDTGALRFPVLELQIADGTLIASLGPQEK